jgi:ankyrin repeat protein
MDLGGLIRDGDRKAALAAIRAGADVNLAQDDGSTALLWAVHNVDHELVKELLARGAKPDVRNQLGATPLAEAASLADAQLVQMLLEARADPNLGNEDGQTPLMLAARTGSLPVVELLVKAGAKINVHEDFRHQTPLMWAIGANSPEVTEFLIRHRADVEARAASTDWGNQITSEPRAQYRPAGGLTPLLYAAKGGCIGCVRALLRAGAGIDRPTPEGVTPLMNAIDNGNYEVADYLLAQGANPHLSDWWGRTALYIAVDMRSRLTMGPGGGGSGQAADAPARPMQPEALRLVQRLLELGVDPNTQLNMHRPGRGGSSARFSDDLLTTGCTPLLRAALTVDQQVVTLLLQHGALPELPNVMGVTPLIAAAGMGGGEGAGSAGVRPLGPDVQDRSIAILKLLIAAGADVNARVSDTSSHTAFIARPNAMTDRQGQTALFGAISRNWTQVAKFLLQNGAHADVKDARGKTLSDALTGGAGGRDSAASEDMRKLIRQAVGTA